MLPQVTFIYHSLSLSLSLIHFCITVLLVAFSGQFKGFIWWASSSSSTHSQVWQLKWVTNDNRLQFFKCILRNPHINWLQFVFYAMSENFFVSHYNKYLCKIFASTPRYAMNVRPCVLTDHNKMPALGAAFIRRKRLSDIEIRPMFNAYMLQFYIYLMLFFFICFN